MAMDSNKRQRPLEDLDVPHPSLKRHRCEPCDVGFTTSRALVRHQRENRQHRNGGIMSSVDFQCGYCDKTFARSHDLQRHFNEQHGNQKTTCLGCGKILKRQAPHKTPDGMSCSAKDVDGSSSRAPNDSAVVSVDEALEPDTRRDSHQSFCNGDCFLSFGKESTKMSIRPKADCAQVYKKQVRRARSENFLPCGICRANFEVHDTVTLFEHLNDHFRELSSKERCDVCQIGFVHAADLERHLQSAKGGHCGFDFHHREPCPGHHPPPRNSRAIWAVPYEAAPKTDDDRFNFSFRIWHWEQCQLRAFIASVGHLSRLKPKPKPCTFHPMNELRCGSCRLLEFSVDDPLHGSSYEKLSRCSLGSDCELACDSDAMMAVTSDLLDRLMQRNIKNRALGRTHSFSEGMSDYPGRRKQCTISVSFAGRSLNKAEIELPDEFRGELDLAYLENDWQMILHRGATAGNLQIAHTAIIQGAKVDEPDPGGRTALELAIASGSVDTVDVLLKSGASLTNWTTGDESPVMLAVRYGSAPVLAALLNHGANIPDLGRLLLEACRQENAACLRLLCRLRPSVTHGVGTVLTGSFLESDVSKSALPDLPYEWYPLTVACEYGGIDVVSTLLDLGANVNHPTGSLFNHPLVVAAAAGRIETIELLLSHGVRIHEEVGEPRADGKAWSLGVMAMRGAVRAGKASAVQALFQAGVAVTDANSEGGHTLCEAIEHGDMDCIRILLENGVSPNGKNCYGDSALMLANRQWQTKLVQLLILHGADVHAQDNYGCTALCTAVREVSMVFYRSDDRNEAKKCVNILREAGAKTCAKPDCKDREKKLCPQQPNCEVFVGGPSHLT